MLLRSSPQAWGSRSFDIIFSTPIVQLPVSMKTQESCARHIIHLSSLTANHTMLGLPVLVLDAKTDEASLPIDRTVSKNFRFSSTQRFYTNLVKRRQEKDPCLCCCYHAFSALLLLLSLRRPSTHHTCRQQRKVREGRTPSLSIGILTPANKNHSGRTRRGALGGSAAYHNNNRKMGPTVLDIIFKPNGTTNRRVTSHKETGRTQTPPTFTDTLQAILDTLLATRGRLCPSSRHTANYILARPLSIDSIAKLPHAACLEQRLLDRGQQPRHHRRGAQHNSTGSPDGNSGVCRGLSLCTCLRLCLSIDFHVSIGSSVGRGVRAARVG